jgi:hypothetical protein
MVFAGNEMREKNGGGGFVANRMGTIRGFYSTPSVANGSYEFRLFVAMKKIDFQEIGGQARKV